MPACSSSPIPAVLAKLGPLDPDSITDLRPYLDAVADPRSPRGRWHSLTCILLVCACATISGAKSIDELAEWGQRAHPSVLATLGARPHPLVWRRSPSAPTIDRVLARIDGDALDAAIGAYLADQHQATAEVTEGADTPRPRRTAIALDGKALKGSARLGQRCRHLLSAITHYRPVTLAQAEVGAKTGGPGPAGPVARGPGAAIGNRCSCGGRGWCGRPGSRSGVTTAARNGGTASEPLVWEVFLVVNPSSRGFLLSGVLPHGRHTAVTSAFRMKKAQYRRLYVMASVSAIPKSTTTMPG